MLQLVPLKETDAEDLAAFARPIWLETFGAILPQGEPEAEYLADLWQSPAAIRQQMSEGLAYFTIEINEMRAGYCAVRAEGVSLFISKIYLLSAYRGKGMGSETLQQLMRWGRRHGMRRAYLHVNVHNAQAIAAYQHNGFRNEEHVVTEVGNGYQADDFVMARVI